MANVSRKIRLDVLLTKEEGEWCAIALDMSLRGYGKTRKKATDDLLDAVYAQLTFALEKGTLDTIFIPAEPKYFRLYAQERLNALKREVKQEAQSPRKEKTQEVRSISLAPIIQRIEPHAPVMQLS